MRFPMDLKSVLRASKIEKSFKQLEKTAHVHKPVLAKEREARFNIEECRRVLKQRKQIVTELSKTVKPKKVIVRGRAGGTHFKAL